MKKISMKKGAILEKKEIKIRNFLHVFLCKNLSEKITFWFTTSYQHFLGKCGNVDNFLMVKKVKKCGKIGIFNFKIEKST